MSRVVPLLAVAVVGSIAVAYNFGRGSGSGDRSVIGMVAGVVVTVLGWILVNG